MEACVTRLCIHFLNGFRSQNDPCKHLPQLFHSQDRITNSPYCLSYQFLESQFGEYGIGSTNISLINIFLSSHSLSAWYCVNIVTGNSWSLMGVDRWVFRIFLRSWCGHLSLQSFELPHLHLPWCNSTIPKNNFWERRISKSHLGKYRRKGFFISCSRRVWVMDVTASG